jgi:hypothetical protein
MGSGFFTFVVVLLYNVLALTNGISDIFLGEITLVGPFCQYAGTSVTEVSFFFLLRKFSVKEERSNMGASLAQASYTGAVTILNVSVIVVNYPTLKERIIYKH